ncbi:hypothetical protein [Allopontixanthobacter sediminis]|uniref:Uncharacterized protein n=1 Tax=Allopontixanthobacter sediminis TaxID=1689985 RepID=A0A845AYL9_9SPHN|nr:hypothetical protein [Allopontixanthobacter sediminis]MXP42974.1 hypothetical protein [Allopontixanthobacter sediminis]
MPEPKTTPMSGEDILGLILLAAFAIGLVLMLVDCSTTTPEEQAEALLDEQQSAQFMAESRAQEQLEFENARIGCEAGVLEACRQYRELID